MAWPYDVRAVEQELREKARAAVDPLEQARLLRTADRVRSGRAIAQVGRQGLSALGRGVRVVGRGAELLLAPATRVGPAVLGAAGRLAKGVLNTPERMAIAGAGVLAAPILAQDANRQYNVVTEKILRAHQDPRRMVEERDVMASLDTFLEKKAVVMADPGMMLRDNAIKGFAGGVGSELARAMVMGLGSLGSGLGSRLFDDPKRKEILTRLMVSDQIIADAVKRNPATKEQILEAYATLNKFAPTLATDVNAVRSFLREVVLGGGHVNYATIKNLIETEKSLHSGMGR